MNDEFIEIISIGCLLGLFAFSGVGLLWWGYIILIR